MADDRQCRDRLEIDDTITRYSTALDTRRWDDLDHVFTPDAVLDYRSAGGIKGSYPEVKEWLSSVLPVFSWTQHLVVNRAVALSPDGKTAISTSLFHNPNGTEIDGAPWLFVVGGSYHDRWVRTPGGWRIRHRVEETTWWQNPMPGLPATPPPLPPDALV